MTNDRSSQHTTNRISQPKSQHGSQRQSGFIQVPTDDLLELSDESTAEKEIGVATIDAPQNLGRSKLDRSSLGRSNQGKGSSIPWWIIIASWILLGLPAFLFSLNQLANLLLPMQVQQNAFNDGLINPNDMELLGVLVSWTATSILLSILAQHTIRRIRSDRRHQRFRYRMKR